MAFLALASRSGIDERTMVTRSAPAPLNDRQRRRHKLRNALHTSVLLDGMTVLLATCAWLLAGLDGLLRALIVGVVALGLNPRLSPRLVIRMYRAREVPRQSMQRAGSKALNQIVVISSIG